MSILNRLWHWVTGAEHPATNESRSQGLARVTGVSSATSARSPELRVEAGAATDTGCVRTVNEDALRVVRPTDADVMTNRGVLAVVCDGMGGHEAGEVASALALETIIKRLDQDDRELPEDLVRAIQAANRAIYEASQENPRLRGMGTTCCVLQMRGGMAYCAHVGDSRCYLMRREELFVMTEDHSAVMELVRRGIITLEDARNHPDKNVISRALGSHREVEVSTWSHPFIVQPGDTFLVCSDGLNDLVDDEQIRRTVGNGEVHAQVACDRLVALARERGGHDNISVAILRMRPADVSGYDAGVTRAVESVP